MCTYTYISIHVHICKYMHIYLWPFCSYMRIYLYLFIHTCYFQLQGYYQFHNFHLKIRIHHAYIRDSKIIRCGDIFESAVWKCCVFSHIALFFVHKYSFRNNNRSHTYTLFTNTYTVGHLLKSFFEVLFVLMLWRRLYRYATLASVQRYGINHMVKSVPLDRC